MNSTPGPGYKGRHGRVLVIRCRGLEEIVLVVAARPFRISIYDGICCYGAIFFGFSRLFDAGSFSLCRILCKSECVCTWQLFPPLVALFDAGSFSCAAFCIKANACALGNCSLPWSHFLMLDRFLVPHSV